MFESGRPDRLVLLAIVSHLQLRRRDVADRLKQPTMVEPVHPLERRVFDRVEVPPWTAVTDGLGLEQTDDRLGQGVVIRVANTADGRLDARFGQPLGVADGEILAASVAVMDDALGAGARPQRLDLPAIFGPFSSGKWLRPDGLWLRTS